MRTKLFGILAATILWTASGCTEPAVVTGTVTADGEKVTEGLLLFQPEPSSNAIKPASGEIQPDGTYEVRTAGNEPLSAGSYKVLYTPPETLEDESGQAVVVSQWDRWEAEDKVLKVKGGENSIPVKLTKKPEPPTEDDEVDSTDRGPDIEPADDTLKPNNN